MKWFTAFFMAWGNFTIIPCPSRKWDSSLNRLMLAFLPEVGALIGLIWAALIWLTDAIGLPVMLSAVLWEWALFRMPGYMHLDGFMDVSDAVMSRRDIEERQKILKDSRVGAFAVISLIFLLLAVFAGLCGAAPLAGAAAYLPTFFLIPVVSRSVSGACVSGLRPMRQSQYAETAADPARRQHIAAILLQMILWAGLCVAAACLLPGRKTSTSSAAGVPGAAVWVLLPAGVEILAELLACRRNFRSLGGMNGDIAGHIICIGEAAAILTLAVLCGIFR